MGNTLFGGGGFGGNQFGGQTPASAPSATFDPLVFATDTFESNSWLPSITTKQSMLGYLRRYLNDPTTSNTGGKYWSDAYLTQLMGQFESQVSMELNTVWIQFTLNIVQGQPTYVLPYNIRRVTRVTWLGFKLWPLTQHELARNLPTYRQNYQSRPQFYSIQYDGIYTLRFSAIPPQSLAANDAVCYTDQLTNVCMVSAYILLPEESANFTLPNYYLRPLMKLFVLWKCYSAEGKMQNQVLAKYFKGKFEGKLAKYKLIIQSQFTSTVRELASVAVQQPFRRQHPILPPNFGVRVRGL